MLKSLQLKYGIKLTIKPVDGLMINVQCCNPSILFIQL